MNYISIVFFISAAVSMFYQLRIIIKFSLLSVFIFTVFISLPEVSVRIISKLSIKIRVKEIIVAMVFALAIPIITLRFFAVMRCYSMGQRIPFDHHQPCVQQEDYSNHGRPVRNVCTNARMGHSNGQRCGNNLLGLIWPRIALLLVTLFVAVYVNMALCPALKENAYHARFQRLVSEIP
jgi:hypothetical protein